MISDEQLSAYIDGELPPGEMARVRAALAADPALAARAQQFARVDALLAEFSSGIDAEPLPEAVLALLGAPQAEAADAGGAAGAATVIAMPARGAPRYRIAAGLALAASLVLAVAIGVQFGSRGAADARFERIARTGAIPGESPLHQALESVPSDETYAAAGEPGIAITPVLSFVSGAREYCREFRVDGETRAARGVACRRADRWVTLKLAAAAAGGNATGQYETATAGTDADFDRFVDSLIAETPLDAAAESALLRRGWRADAGLGE